MERPLTGRARANGCSVEEFVEEAAPAFALVVAVVAGLLAVVTVVSVWLRRTVGRWLGRTVGGRLGVRRLLRGGVWGVGLWRCLASVPPGFGLEQSLQLAAIEEDAATLGALIDGDAAALVASH